MKSDFFSPFPRPRANSFVCVPDQQKRTLCCPPFKSVSAQIEPCVELTLCALWSCCSWWNSPKAGVQNKCITLGYTSVPKLLQGGQHETFSRKCKHKRWLSVISPLTITSQAYICRRIFIWQRALGPWFSFNPSNSSVWQTASVTILLLQMRAVLWFDDLFNGCQTFNQLSNWGVCQKFRLLGSSPRNLNLVSVG